MNSEMQKRLESHRFFAGLPDHFAGQISQHARSLDFKVDALLTKTGQPANEFFLIEKGHVALETHAPGLQLTIETLGPNDILGWSWLIPPFQWRFDARAVEPTQVLAIDGEWLRNECEANAELGYALLKRVTTVFVDRLAHTRMQLLDIYNPRSEDSPFIAPM